MTPNSLPPRATSLLLGLVAGLLLVRLGALPLVGPDEPRYARVAVEMQRAREWLTPTLAGQPWLKKPPLYYWLAGGAYRWLGESETAARLPSVVAGVALVGLTALLGARLFGTRAGLHAGFILGTSLLFFAYGRAAAMDMLVATLVTASMGLLALRYLRIAGPCAIPAAYVCVAMALLAKGMVGLLPGLVALGFIAVRRDLRLLRESLSPLGLVLLLLVALPWHLALYGSQGRAFIDIYLLNHNLERFTSTIHNHPGSPLYYLPVILAGLYPWTGLLVPAAALTRPRRASDLLLLLWFLLPLALFSAAGSKLPGYILPCLPPLALLLGRAAAQLGAGDIPGWTERPAALFGLALGAVAFSTPFLLMRQGEPAWRLLLPAASWGLLVTVLFSRRLEVDPAGALGLLRVGAAGFLLLLTLAAPALLAHRESGRDLFVPARGREVLAWGAWRTAWMSGYFYNDGRVRPVGSLSEVVAAVGAGPALVLCGAEQRRQLEATGALQTLLLATGPRENALLKVERR